MNEKSLCFFHHETVRQITEQQQSLHYLGCYNGSITVRPQSDTTPTHLIVFFMTLQAEPAVLLGIIKRKIDNPL